jgi:DNA-binding NarL/FixJ family response regulator
MRRSQTSYRECFEGLRAGAIGYLLKDVLPEKLFEAIRLSARGESFIQPSVARKVVVEFARLSEKPVHTENHIRPLNPYT